MSAYIHNEWKRVKQEELQELKVLIVTAHRTKGVFDKCEWEVRIDISFLASPFSCLDRFYEGRNKIKHDSGINQSHL